MLPYGENIDDLILDFEEDVVESTQTFELNTLENIVGGKIDDLAALQQTIYLMLSTEADQYLIYSYTYGLQTVDLIGKPIHYVMAVLPIRIKETLMSDDRITDVSDFEFEMDKRKLKIRFRIQTIYGEDIEADAINGNYIIQSSPVEISLGEIELALNGVIKLQNSYIDEGAM